MAQYPVEDTAGLFEAVNYLLSGPSGLGQNFQGFSSYQPAYVTGTFRQPYTIQTNLTTIPPVMYVPPININNITPLEVNTATNKTRFIQIDFTPQTNVPFNPGDTVVISGVVDVDSSGFYDDTYLRGVLSGSTSSVIMQTINAYEWPAYVSGGTIEKNNALGYVSTDCNARVTVQGPTEIVFITSQCTLDFSYTCTTASNFDVLVSINRYRGGKPSEVGAADYVFEFDAHISEQAHSYSTTASGTLSAGQNIFTTVLDTPSFGYYWYITEISFVTKPTYRYNSTGQIITGNLQDGTPTGTSSATTGTYTAITPTTLTGSGAGATMDVKIKNTNPTYNADSVTLTFNGDGSGYAVGDLLTIPGTSIGGASPANDMTVLVTAIGYPGDAKPETFTVGLRSMTAQVIKQ